MDYEIQYAKIATGEKLADRFLNTQIKSNADLNKVHMGEIISLIEILTPWFTTAQIGQTIISTFTTAYYEGGSTSDLDNFEAALKKVNETLAQITQNGETDWIGNLNATLGVIVENKIHLAQAGRSEVYIFRDGKVNHLTEGVTQNVEPHPLKTFADITSGELKSHDKILIANPELYKFIDLDNLRQIITLNTPDEAVMNLGKLLKKKKANTVNALIVNLLTTEELAKLPIKDENTTIYLDRPLESIWAGVSRTWQQLIFPILKSIGKSTKKASDKSLSFTKNYVSALQARKTAREKEAVNVKDDNTTPEPIKEPEPIKKRDLFEKEFMSDGNEEDNLLKDENFRYSPELDVHYYHEKQKENVSSKRFDKIIGFFSTIGQAIKKVGTWIWHFFQNKKTRPYFLVVCAVIILIVIGLIINSKRSSGANDVNLSQAQESLRSAEQDQKNANQAALGNDNEKAKQLCASAIEKVAKILDYPIVGDSAKKVRNDCNTQIDKLTATSRFDSLNPLITIEEPARSVFVTSGQTYIITNKDIFRGLISGGKPEKVASLSGSNGDFQFGTLYNKTIFLYTSAQKVFKFNTDTNKLDPSQISGGSFETANNISSYIGNIYLLDSILGQIYKHSLSGDTFGAGESYINAGGIDIKNSKSLAIDGDIFVLRENGEVLKFTKGKLQDFSLRDTPTPYSKIEKPIKIYTNDDMSSIYILDAGKNRILEYAKDGGYIHQYVLPSNLNNISDFSVNVKNKKLWLLNDKSVYEISI